MSQTLGNRINQTEKLKKQRDLCKNTKKEYHLLYYIIQKNTEATISSYPQSVQVSLHIVDKYTPKWLIIKRISDPKREKREKKTFPRNYN